MFLAICDYKDCGVEIEATCIRDLSTKLKVYAWKYCRKSGQKVDDDILFCSFHAKDFEASYIKSNGSVA